MTFGSIDDVTAPISSSPAAVPPIKSEGVKTFGSVPATPTSAPANIKPSTSSSSQTPSTQSKFDVKKLFQAPSAPEPSSEPPAISSPSTRSSQLPQSSPQTSHAQPSPMGHAYQTFVPGGLRPSQNGAQPGGPPRSPVYPRQIPNGQVNGANGRPNGAQMPQTSGPGPMPTAMPSPRMGHPHGGQPAGLPHVPPPVPVPGWPGYYVRISHHCSKLINDESSFSTLLSILACPSTCPIHRVGTSLLKRINHPRDLVGLILACPCPLVTSLHPSTRLVPPRLLPLCRTRRILHIRPPHHMRIL